MIRAARLPGGGRFTRRRAARWQIARGGTARCGAARWQIARWGTARCGAARWRIARGIARCGAARWGIARWGAACWRFARWLGLAAGLRRRRAVAAEQEVEVGAGAQLIQGAGDAGGSQLACSCGDPLVGGEHVRRGQITAAQRGGAGVFAPAQHPRVALRLFPAGSRGIGVGGKDGAGQRRPQLPAGLLPGAGEDAVFDRRGVPVAQHVGGFGDDPRPDDVDLPGVQRGHRFRQFGGQLDREIQVRVRAAPGQGQRQRQLIGRERADHRRKARFRGGPPPGGSVRRSRRVHPAGRGSRSSLRRRDRPASPASRRSRGALRRWLCPGSSVR